jgi:twitching motility two-component system response regulator PilH
VLIVDDSATIVAAVGKMLRSAGCITLEAPTAEKGLELVSQEKPDLVFLDIVLPGMNGFAALRAIRRDPDLRDTPVIMMSGNEQAVEQFFGTRIGADDFMKKPFSRYEIFFRIERLLDSNLTPRRAIPRAEPSPSGAPA